MQSIPKDWHSTAHERWLAGDQQGAINALLMALNDFLKPKRKPEGFVLQFSYYLFLLEDYSGAETAGLSAVLIDRHDNFSHDGYRRISSLDGVLDLVAYRHPRRQT